MVSNDAESVNSVDAELLINVPPEIKQHPQSQLINPGSLVTFSVHASGVPPLLFQWQRDGVDIDGATSGKYTIGSVSLKNEGFYSCSVRNDAGYVISDEAELFLNATPASDAVSTAPESAKPATDKISKRSCNQTASADSSQKPTKTMKIKPSAPTGLSEEKKSAGARLTKQQLFAFKHLSLNAPAGQGAYVHNGNTLTFNGTAFPNATLVSARLEDHQGYLIRNISKRLKFDRETGNISGSIFVGSFRGSETVHLKIIVQGSSSSQTVSGTSNTLFIDQGPPKVRVTQPANHARFNTSPIVIYGTASDDISGIAAVEISIDGGATYRNANMIRNHQWLFSFTPKTPDTEYTIKVRSTDIVGLSTISDNLTIHYSSPLPPIKKIKKMPEIKSSAKINGNTGKSPKDDGICTYRIINLNNNNFQPTDLFTLNEQMAIIVKGYGGKVVTVRIINPSIKKVIFEFSDYIPAHKSKMWKWELSQTGAFQAALFVDGNYEDQISFTIIQ
ncbi:MAG: Ig-like domain-containing protein [Desulfobacteraceae bacterium]|jgi:hypothetical protein|nr:Ig-like domain-containing protein [Desulfobacteraceae bacterium]